MALTGHHAPGEDVGVVQTSISLALRPASGQT